MEPLLKVTNLTKQLDAFSLKDISFSWNQDISWESLD